MTKYDAFNESGVWRVYALDETGKPTGIAVKTLRTEREAVDATHALNDTRKKGYIAPRPASLLSRRKTGISIYKGDDGLRYMFIVTSNSYKDRDDETITTKALQNYVDAAWAVEDKCLPENPLLFWHDGEPIGDIVWTDMEGPFLIEVAKERANRVVRLTTKGKAWKTTIKQIWDAFETARYSWGASHGFKYPDSAFEDGTYKQIAKFETSILPLDAAANPYTFAGVLDDMNKNQVLENLLGQAGVAEKLRKGVRTVKQELDRRGLEHKAAKPQTAKKGIVEDLDTVISEFASKLTDSGADVDTLKNELREAVVEALMKGPHAEPDEDNVVEDVETEYMEDDPTEEDAMQAAVMSKQIALMDRLIKSQESIVTDTTEMKNAVSTVAKAVSPLVDLPEQFKSLADRLAAVEKRLSGAPRRASVAEETIVDDKKLADAVKEQHTRYEELFPGSGIKLRAE